MFRILIYYKDEVALNNYLDKYGCLTSKQFLKKRSCNERLYESDGVILRCIKGISEGSRGCKAHLVAVQEELTWGVNWDEILGCIIKPQIISPIPVQIFDGICPEDYSE